MNFAKLTGVITSATRKGHQHRWDPQMKVILGMLLLLVCLGAGSFNGFAGDDLFSCEQYVKYDKDNVSVAFSNLRAADAAQLMHATTGISITLPAAIQSKTINLMLDSAKVDQAVRSLLTSLQLNNSFLVYDRNGKLKSVVALEKAANPPVTESQSSEEDQKKANNPELTAKERDSLLRDIGRWAELSADDRAAIHARLKTIPPSKDREQVVKEYVRLVLGIADQEPPATE